MKKRHSRKTNVLLVNITRLGDMLQATPTIAGIRHENRDCKITVLVEKQFDEVCRFIPNVDEVVSLDLGMTVRLLAQEKDSIVDAYDYVGEVVEDLRNRNFDYCLNMSSSGYTALLLKLIGIKRNGGWNADDEGNRIIESDWARLFATSVFHQNRQYNSLNLVDVFRCSADVEEHPNKLLINIEKDALDFAEAMIREANFTNTGPIIAVQAGASQAKRQWDPNKFIQLIDELVKNCSARVILTGSKKELPIINQIIQGCDSKNVFSAAGKTTISQLAALLKMSELLITGDTGPMHIAVAAGTPVVALFLASAYGFETGPYSTGNLVLQPVIVCGPCNPNKPCSRPDCHDLIDPKALAKLVALRIEKDILSVDEDLIDPRRVTVFRSYFDKLGFCDLWPINGFPRDYVSRYRDAYKKMWLDDLGNFEVSEIESFSKSLPKSAVGLHGINDIVNTTIQGKACIDELCELIKDPYSPPRKLAEVNEAIAEVDSRLETLGFNFPYLEPITRMFVFSKENLSGTDALNLASQMREIYQDLERRCAKLQNYYSQI